MRCIGSYLAISRRNPRLGQVLHIFPGKPLRKHFWPEKIPAYLYMTSKSFFTGLLAITASAGLGLALLHFLLPPAQVHWRFSIATLLLFVLLCLGLFFAGQNAVRSSSKVAFNGLISASVFGKILLAMGFLFAYQKISHPPNQWFVAIFLWSYVMYTGFEVWFMTRMARA